MARSEALPTTSVYRHLSRCRTTCRNLRLPSFLRHEQLLSSRHPACPWRDLQPRQPSRFQHVPLRRAVPPRLQRQPAPQLPPRPPPRSRPSQNLSHRLHQWCRRPRRCPRRLWQALLLRGRLCLPNRRSRRHRPHPLHQGRRPHQLHLKPWLPPSQQSLPLLARLLPLSHLQHQLARRRPLLRPPRHLLSLLSQPCPASQLRQCLRQATLGLLPAQLLRPNRHRSHRHLLLQHPSLSPCRCRCHGLL